MGTWMMKTDEVLDRSNTVILLCEPFGKYPDCPTQVQHVINCILDRVYLDTPKDGD